MSGRIGPNGLLVLLVVLGVAVFGTVEMRHVDHHLTRSVGHALRRTFGTDIVVNGPSEVRLWPRPHVVLTDVRLGSGSGPRIVIPVLEATQSLGSLLSGRLAFSQFRLIGPTATVDADAATGGTHPSLGLLGRVLPGRVVIQSGTLSLQSSHMALRGELSEIDAVLDGIDRNGAATLEGQGTWRGTRLDLAARIEPFFDFVLGRAASGGVKLRSPLLNAAIEGHLREGMRGGFEGEVAATVPSLPDLLRTASLPGGLGQAVERVSFSGSGVANTDTVTFSDARVALDDTPFEGSLAWQPNGGRWAWTGTFATDTLDLTAALNAVSALHDRGGHWSDAPWSIDAGLLGDIDLRISASRALLGPLTVEDAAFSALCRDGRIEAGFSEARSLDGLIRGRAVAAVTGHDVDLKVDLSMSQMDLDPLAQAIGTAGISGSASGHLSATARGTTPHALVESLVGHGQVSVRGGSLPALQSLVDVSSLGVEAPAWLRSRAGIPFDLATADLQLAGSTFSVTGGKVVEPDGQQAFSAEASLLDRSFSLIAVPQDGSKADAPATNLAGVWGQPPRLLRASEEAVSPGRRFPVEALQR